MRLSAGQRGPTPSHEEVVAEGSVSLHKRTGPAGSAVADVTIETGDDFE